MAGVDQFGGNNDVKPVLAAYKMGVKEHGEAFMRDRFIRSARRLLRNIFRVGLFENPYLDPEESKAIAGNKEFMRLGFEAQVKSVIMLKNKDKTLPLGAKTKVYIPKRHINAGHDWFGLPVAAKDVAPIDPALAESYFELSDDPAAADCAICYIESPRWT
jgi:beta-glucosidase